MADDAPPKDGVIHRERPKRLYPETPIPDQSQSFRGFSWRDTFYKTICIVMLATLVWIAHDYMQDTKLHQREILKQLRLVQQVCNTKWQFVRQDEIQE
jgi:hypothetical protein